MLQECPFRDAEAERWERHRYDYLEKLYLLTGPHCEAVVDPRDVEEQLGLTMEEAAPVTDDLVRLGYLVLREPDHRICISSRGVEYLQTDAWRRRSIRE